MVPPVASLCAGFQFASVQHTFIDKDVLRLSGELSRCVNVPARGGGITYDVESLGLDRSNDGSVGLAKIFCRHGPLSQIECQTVFASFGYAPLVVGITCMHGEFSIGDDSLANFRSSHHRTYEGSIPTASGQAEFHFACVQFTLPSERQRVSITSLQSCRIANVPSRGRGISHHVER